MSFCCHFGVILVSFATWSPGLGLAVWIMSFWWFQQISLLLHRRFLRISCHFDVIFQSFWCHFSDFDLCHFCDSLAILMSFQLNFLFDFCVILMSFSRHLCVIFLNKRRNTFPKFPTISKIHKRKKRRRMGDGFQVCVCVCQCVSVSVCVCQCVCVINLVPGRNVSFE